MTVLFTSPTSSTVAAVTSSAPASMVPTSQGNVYGVNGQQRGFVVVGGTTAYPIGVTAAPVITAASTASPQYFYVASIDVTSAGENYNSPPTVVISGVSGAKAELDGPELARVTFTTTANTFTGPPAVALTGGQAFGASANAVVQGAVAAINLEFGNAWYFTPPAITFFPAAGVTAVRPAQARSTLTYTSFAATTGRLASVVITDRGVYQWSSATLGDGARPVSATASTGIGGVTPALAVESAGALQSISITSGGSFYSTPPTVTFSSRGPLKKGGGAEAIAAVTGTSVSGCTLMAVGSGYDGAVAVGFENDAATATAIMAPRLSGKYLCGVRLVGRDGVPGNFCQLVEVDCGERASSIIWNLSSVLLQDGTPNRIQKMELWRTTGDQAITMYKVTEFSTTQSTYTDTIPDSQLSDAKRTGYDAIRILTEEGFTNAFRYGIPPQKMSVVTMFQDRAWYAVDTTGTEPNTIYFSAIDEPESVGADAQVVIQTNGRDSDRITGLMPFDGVLYVGQSRSLTRLTVSGSPYDGASATPVAQRGLLNDRCWERFEDVAYIVDSAGLYAFKGSGAEPLSDPVGNYWTQPLIDFSKSRWFFVQVNQAERVVRFHFVAVGSGATYPNTALCYSLVTQAWWTETYSKELSAKLSAESGGRQAHYVGHSSGVYRTSSGTSDDGDNIPYSMRTGFFPLSNDPKRAVRITYTPVSSSLGVSLFYNGSTSPRPNAASVSRGDGFVSNVGSTQATLDMSASRSSLGTATGFAQLMLSGRLDDRSAGGDRNVAIGLSGVMSGEAPVLHSLEVEGAG